MRKYFKCTYPKHMENSYKSRIKRKHNFKTGKETDHTSPQRRHKNGQWVHEQMFNSISHWENAGLGNVICSVKLLLGMPACHVRVGSNLASAYASRPSSYKYPPTWHQRMVHILESLLSIRYNHLEFWAPGFCRAQSWVSCGSGLWKTNWNLSVSVALPFK